MSLVTARWRDTHDDFADSHLAWDYQRYPISVADHDGALWTTWCLLCLSVTRCVLSAALDRWLELNHANDIDTKSFWNFFPKVLMVSKWVGDLMNISLYDLHVEIKCIPFVEVQRVGHLGQSFLSWLLTAKKKVQLHVVSFVAVLMISDHQLPIYEGSPLRYCARSQSTNG